MKTVDKYFKEKAKDVSFIEVKEDSQIKLDKHSIANLPLALVTDNFLKEVKAGSLDQEIKLEKIIEGILYIMGADPSFPYIEDYKKILQAYSSDIKSYILHRVAVFLQEGKFDLGGLWLRSLLLLDPSNVDGIFNYGLVLEEIGKGLLGQDKKKDGEDFIKYSSNQLESILDIDEDFSLAYYKLGYHYKYFERYMKASLIWNKFLVLSKDDLLLEEIREEVGIIKDDAYFETGFTYLNFQDYERALEAFLKLLPNHGDSWNVNFLIGQSYMGLEEYESAVKYMEKAIELNKEEADIYNELGIIYFNMGKINKAEEVFTRGIDNGGEDYKLFFNRCLAYIQEGNIQKALGDIARAYELNPNDPNIIEQKRLLEGLN